jgi:hypothetical protein
MSLLSRFRRHHAADLASKQAVTVPVEAGHTYQVTCTSEPRTAAALDDPILPQVGGPSPMPCCTRYDLTSGWGHGPDCTTMPAERFPLAGPRQPLISVTGTRWDHLNGGGYR